MEEKTFNLNRAISNWRNGLKQQGIAPETIEELESHLIESTESLQAGGLSEREAFYTAADRLGDPEELSASDGLKPVTPPNSGSGCVRLLGITMVAAGLAVLLGAFALLILFFTAPKEFSAQAVMQVARSARADETVSYNSFIQTQFALIGSREILDEVIAETGLASNWSVTEEQARARLENHLKTENILGTDLIKISVDDPDPNLASAIVNSIAESYRDRINQASGEITIAIHERAEPATSPAKLSWVSLLIPLAGVILCAIIIILVGALIWRRGN